jgi:hypothetical protein
LHAAFNGRAKLPSFLELTVAALCCLAYGCGVLSERADQVLMQVLIWMAGRSLLVQYVRWAGAAQRFVLWFN